MYIYCLEAITSRHTSVKLALALRQKISDIVNLDIRKLIYIDGCYWRINKVIDYMPQANKSTKIELVEWTDIGESAPSTPNINQNDGSWNPGGAQTYDPNHGW